MPDSESLPTSDDILFDDIAEDVPAEGDATADDAELEQLYQYRSAPDPWVRYIIIAIAAIIVLWLAGILSAMMFGMLSPAKSPRTAVERNLNLYAAQVDSGKADTQTWAKYIDVLVTAGQLGKAREIVNTALAQAKSDKSYILAEQARLELVAKNYPTAVQDASEAMTQADSEWAAKKAANIAKQITMGVPRPDSWGLAALTKAQALVGSGDTAGAIKAYDVYLQDTPTDSDVLTARGDLKAKAGDTAGAAADYKAALKFIPDYKPALDGLNKIGAGAK